MVRYDFGTIIDEVPKNLHFVRILGAEDVFDSLLLHEQPKSLEIGGLGFFCVEREGERILSACNRPTGMI